MAMAAVAAAPAALAQTDAARANAMIAGMAAGVRGMKANAASAAAQSTLRPRYQACGVKLASITGPAMNRQVVGSPLSATMPAIAGTPTPRCAKR